MEIFLPILVVLVLARLFGEGAERFGQSASVGELLAGIVLTLVGLALASETPWLFAVTHLEDNAVLAHLSDLGIFCLVLMAGIEMQPKEIAETSKAAFLVAIGGMLVPLAAGAALGWLLIPDSPLKLPQVLMIAVAMSITAVPATVKVLNEFDLLHSKLGETIVAAAVFDDVFGLMLLAVVTAIVQTGDMPDLGSALWLLGKVAVFFAITTALGVHIYPRVSRGLKQMQADALELSALVIAALAYGLLAELLGVHWILGVFMAGLYFESARVGEAVYQDIRVTVTAITVSVLGPFFFVSIGLSVNLDAIPAAPVALIALSLVAFAGKIVGAGLAARLAGLGGPTSLAIGVGMTSRGAVQMVVLSVAHEAGVFAAADGDPAIVRHLFSALVFMALANTFLMPVVLRWVLRRRSFTG